MFRINFDPASKAGRRLQVEPIAVYQGFPYAPGYHSSVGNIGRRRRRSAERADYSPGGSPNRLSRQKDGRYDRLGGANPLLAARSPSGLQTSFHRGAVSALVSHTLKHCCASTTCRLTKPQAGSYSPDATSLCLHLTNKRPSHDVLASNATTGVWRWQASTQRLGHGQYQKA